MFYRVFTLPPDHTAAERTLNHNADQGYRVVSVTSDRGRILVIMEKQPLEPNQDAHKAYPEGR